MSEFSTYFENAIIDLMRNQALSEFSAYVALFTSDVGLEADNPTSEVSGGGYARELAGLSAAAGGLSANAADITFTTATGAWGTVSHVALVDHPTNTNWGVDVHVIMWSPFDDSKVMGTGDVFIISAGDLDVTVA